MFDSGVHRQVYATVAASMSIFISGMWLGWPSSVVDKLASGQADVRIDYAELSWIVCMMDVGNVISPLFGGYLMDRIGRKPSIAVLGPLFAVSWMLTLHVPATWALYAARLTAGLGKGMSYTVVPVFLGEIAGVDVRGALGSVFTIQMSTGFLFEVIVGPRVSYGTLNAVSAVFPALFFAMFVWVPESPYYLLQRGRQTAAEQCLRWYRCRGTDVGPELCQMQANVRQDMENKATFRELFASRKNVRALAIVITACVAQRAGGVSSLIAYSALILPEPAPLVGRSEHTTAFAALLIAVNFVGLALVDRVGRKPLLIFSEASLAAVTFLFGLYYYAAARDADAAAAFAWLPYLCHALFPVVYSLGVGFIPVVFLGEMFPANVRAHCSAIASITLAVSSFVSNKMFLHVSQNYGFHVMFWGFAAVNAACACLAYQYAIETSGETFLEIQQTLLERTTARSGRADHAKHKHTEDAL